MIRYVTSWSFVAVLAVLAAGTIAGVGALVSLHKLSLVPVVVGLAVGIGIIYVVAFARPLGELEPAPPVEAPPTPTEALPVPGAAASMTQGPPMASEEYEPDYDPVEEADRLETAKLREDPPASGRQDPE